MKLHEFQLHVRELDGLQRFQRAILKAPLYPAVSQTAFVESPRLTRPRRETNGSGTKDIAISRIYSAGYVSFRDVKS